MSTTPGQEPSETEQLLIRLRKDFSTFKPPSKFHKEIIAAMNSNMPKKELTEAIHVIMDKHGYDKLETTEIDKLFGYEPESETKLADPIKPPVTTPADAAAAPFSITSFCLIYDVKSTDPIYQTVAIQDEGEGKNPKIKCVVDLKTEPKTYALTLEREAKTGHFWVSWTTPDTTVWRVRLYSQLQGGKIVRYFKGVFLPAGGGDPVDFFGEEKPIEVEDEDREPGWWATYGPWVGVGAILSIGPITSIVHAILSYRLNKSKEAADKLKAEELALEGKKDLAKKKALAEMDAVEKFFESTSEPRREQLLAEIKQATTAEFHDMIDKEKIAQNRWNGGDLKFEFNGQDKPMREAFDKIVKDKIAEWVPMNPIVSVTEINQALVDEGYLSQAELQEMETAVREKATKRLDRTFTDPYGNYRPLVDATLEAMRVELNANTLTARVNTAQTEINLNNVVINVLENNLKNLKSDVDTAAAKIKELDKDKNQQDYATKRDHWEKLIQTTNNDIQKNVDEHKIREQEKTTAKDKYEEAKKKKDAVEVEKNNADKKRIDGEKRFKKHIKIGF